MGLLRFFSHQTVTQLQVVMLRFFCIFPKPNVEESRCEARTKYKIIFDIAHGQCVHLGFFELFNRLPPVKNALEKGGYTDLDGDVTFFLYIPKT